MSGNFTKKIFFLISLFSFGLFFAGCTKQSSSEACPLTGGVACWIASWTVDYSNLSWAMEQVLLAIEAKDMQTLSTFVWPDGLRISPYQHINTGSDVVLSTQEVANGLSISRSYLWGSYDGSGEPIDLWIGQYFEKFVSDEAWTTAPIVSLNQTIQRGNTINNIDKIYTGKQWAEYYFSGFDAQFGGMDWKSLTLVFEPINGQWYLIWIIHWSWTI